MLSLVPFRRAAACRPTAAPGLGFEGLLDGFFDGFWTGGSAPDPGTIRMEVTQTEDGLRIRAEVPGVAPEDLEITLADDVLTLSGEKKVEEERQEGARHYSERSFGKFQRAVRLPFPVEAGDVTAEHAHGVVTVTLKKSEAARPQRIEVRPS